MASQAQLAVMPGDMEEANTPLASSGSTLYAPLTAPVRSRRTAALAVASALALAAAAVGAATWQRARSGAAAAASPLVVESMEFEVKETWDEGRKRLLVEGNLAKLLSGRLAAKDPEAAAALQAPKFRDTCRDHAHQLFDHVVQASGLHLELLARELEAFRGRFAHAMHEGCREGGGRELDARGWLKAAADELEGQKPVMTQAIADSLNEHDIGFRVEMRDWMVDKSVANFHQSLGRTARPEGLRDVVRHHAGLHSKDVEALPSEFDSRKKWPKCAKIIERVMNQGECGSCFVFGAMGSIEARLCVASDGAFSGDKHVLSRGEATSCAVSYDGCQGGWEYNVMEWADKSPFGINSDSCVGYFGVGEGIDHFQCKSQAPPCPTSCRKEYPRSLQEDYFKLDGIGKYSLLLDPNAGKGEKLEQCKRAVYEGGPIPFGIYASYTFMGYATGIYKSCKGRSANHAVHFIGWGEEKGEGYLLAKNSWGPNWGLNGHFHAAFCEMTDCTIPGDIHDPKVALPLAELKAS